MVIYTQMDTDPLTQLTCWKSHGTCVCGSHPGEREFHSGVGLAMPLAHFFSFGSLQLTAIYMAELIGFMGYNICFLTKLSLTKWIAVFQGNHALKILWKIQTQVNITETAELIWLWHSVQALFQLEVKWGYNKLWLKLDPRIGKFQDFKYKFISILINFTLRVYCALSY